MIAIVNDLLKNKAMSVKHPWRQGRIKYKIMTHVCVYIITITKIVFRLKRSTDQSISGR